MIVIGERINASRKSIREAIAAKDGQAVIDQILAQDHAGAHYIDLNAGTGAGDMDRERDDLCWLIDLALEATEKSFVLDSSEPTVLAGAAEHLAGRRPWMLNSIKHDQKTMEAGLALAASHDVPVIALAMDEEGIPDQAPRRIEICERIAKAAEAANVSAEKLFFDPLVLPVAADITQGMVTLRSLSGIKQAVPGCNTTMGLSNFSHGLKKRRAINAAFLISAITHGLDSAICDPTLPDINRALLLGNLISGRDRHCRRFARAVRKGVFEDTLSK